MLSKRFMAWVGVGLLCVATIPVLAAPHLARLARKPVTPAKQVTPKVATTSKAKAPVAKAAPTTKPAKVVVARPVRPAKVKKAATPPRKAMAASTAKKLLH